MKTILVDAVNTFVIKDSGIDSEMFALLERFPNKKIILTNANDEQMQAFGLKKMPYEVFTLSHDPEKTDPSYFLTFLEQYHLTPNEVVYFEHNPDAVESAESVGILSYQYDPKKRDLTELEIFLTNGVS